MGKKYHTKINITKIKKKLKKWLHFSTSSTIITLVADEETKTKQAPLAHLVEHLTLNQGVQGSSPWRRTCGYRFGH